MKKVKEVMTGSPRTCEKGDSLHSVAKKMLQDNIGSIPVVGENKQVIGMITDRDVVLALGKNENRPATELTVIEAMTSGIHTVKAEDNVETALRIMRTKKVGRLPVVDDHQQLQGIVSLNRVVKEVSGTSEEAEIEYKGNENVLKTLQSIAERNNGKTVAVV